MRRIILAAAMAAVAVSATGCWTYRDFGRFKEAKRTENAVRVRALGDQGAALEVDLLKIGTGYADWLSERTGEAAVDTALDAAMLALAGFGCKQVYEWIQPDDNEGQPPDPPEVDGIALPSQMNISGDTVVVNIGSQNSADTTGAATSSGGAE